MSGSGLTVPVMGSLRAELRKMARRPAVLVLATMTVVSVVVLIYGLLYVDVHFPSAGDSPQQIAEARQRLYPAELSWAVSRNLGMFYNVLALILGALAFGSEYGWGTLKTLLIQGPGRLETFLAKHIAVAATVAVYVVLLFGVAASCSYVAAMVDGAPVRWPSAAETGGAVASALLILLMWASMGAVLAVALRGAAPALGLGIVYAVSELLIYGSLGGGQRGGALLRCLPGINAIALASSFDPQQLRGASVPLVGPWQAAVVLAAYVCVFVLVAALFVRYRDV